MKSHKIKHKILDFIFSILLGIIIGGLLRFNFPTYLSLPLIILVGILVSGITYTLLNRDTTKDKITKGTKLITPKEFQRKISGDGLYIPCKVEPHFLLKPFIKPKIVNLAIRKSDETVHILIAGDSGTGKSALQHTFLYQIAARENEAVAIYDPSLEFYNRHYKASRGDILLYPMDKLCPYWNILDEIRNRLDAAALAKSLIPDKREGVTDFWEQAPRQLLVQLFLKLKNEGLGHETLVKWLADQEMIFDAVEETAAEVLIDRKAHGQRSGVLASLSKISDALELLPPNDGRRHFSFTDWAEQKQRGWLFIGTKGAGEREGLRPLISCWLDTAFARLMEQENKSPCFIFIDELPSLQKLPSLKTALFEGRKYGLKFVLGFQGRAQIEQLYGRDAETLMSMPDTRIFLRTKEFAASDWCAKNIGLSERERRLESFTSSINLTQQGRESLSVSTDKRADYLVYPVEIQNLPKLTGYLRYDRYAVPIAFNYPQQPLDYEKILVSGVRQLESYYLTAKFFYITLGLISTCLVLYCYKIIYLDLGNPHWSIKLIIIVCFVTAISSAITFEKKNQNAKSGAKAEEEVFAKLTNNLTNRGWKFIFNHKLQANWDVDVIAKSPSDKIFILDIKSHKGTKVITKNKIYRRYGNKEYELDRCPLKGAKAQAIAVAKEFNYHWVIPILCFTNGSIEYRDNLTNPQGVLAISLDDLIDTLIHLDTTSLS